MLKEKAPTFWEAFHEEGGAWPEFAEAYREIQALTPEQSAERTDADLGEGFKTKERELFDAEVERKLAERKKIFSLTRWWEEAVVAFVDRYLAISKLERSLVRSGQAIDPADSPYRIARGMRFVRSQQSAYMHDVKASVTEILGKLDEETTTDFGKYLTYARISLGDRGVVWNPHGITAEESDRRLKQLEKRVGAERFALLEKAAAKFAELRAEYIIPEIEKGGVFSPAFIEKVVKNSRYATFDVLKRVSRMQGKNATESITGLDMDEYKDRGGGRPVGAHKQTGTTAAIRNSFTATVDNDMKLLAYIDRNNFIKSAVDLISNSPKNPVGFVARRQQEIAPGLYDRRKTTVFFVRDGKTEAWEVSPEIYAALKNPGSVGAVMKAFDLVNNVLRDVLTQKNPAFWVWNMQRDFRSFHRNAPGYVWEKIAYMYMARKEIKEYIKDGKMSVDVKSALKERAMLPSSAYSKDNFYDVDSEFYAMLEKHTDEASKAGFLSRKVGGMLQALDKMNDTIELTTKLAGYKMLRDKGEMSAADRAFTVRTRIGTPDIYAGGTHTFITNRLFMFSNVALQGLRESLNVIKENPRRAAGIWALYTLPYIAFRQLAERELLAKAMGWLFGDDSWEKSLAEWFESAYGKIPRFDKVYRTAIPLPIPTKSGRQAYIPLPHSELGQALAGIGDHAVNLILDPILKENGVEGLFREVGGAGSDALNLAPVGPGSVHPLLKVVLAWWDYWRGNNPTDPYRGEHIIRRKNYQKSLVDEYIDMGKWSWNNIGLATLWRLDDNALDIENKNWFEIAAGLPIVSNAVGRIVRFSRETD
jgi:hypothetical protein